MILWIAIVLVILWMVHECSRLHQFNYEGCVKEIHSVNSTVIHEYLKPKHPLLIHNVPMEPVYLSGILKDNPGYILRDSQSHLLLDTFKDIESMSLYQRPTLSRELGFHERLLDMGSPFQTTMTCGSKTDLSLFKGYHQTPLTKATHNITLLSVFSGTCIVYLINPKHEAEIHNQLTDHIKKWSHRVVLKPNAVLSIPTQWLYVYECKGEVVVGRYYANTYGTHMYNAFR
mgnify:CR=1 FL=1|jgi:hypothetical protein